MMQPRKSCATQAPRRLAKRQAIYRRRWWRRLPGCAIRRATGRSRSPREAAGQYGFRYATLDKILDMARPVLAEEGLILFQPITTNDKGALVLTTRLLHRSGEYMETSMPLPAAGADPQTLGSAITYLRRYAVTSLLGIASDEDDDGNRAAGNKMRDVAPRHERLRDEAGRAERSAQGARRSGQGGAERGPRHAPPAHMDRRGRSDRGEPRQAGVGSAGSPCRRRRPQQPGPSAGVGFRARRAHGLAGGRGWRFETAWGGEWAHTLMIMQEEAAETYRALQGHVVAQIRRARAAAPKQIEPPPPSGATEDAPTPEPKQEAKPTDGPDTLVLLSADGEVEQFTSIKAWEDRAMEQISSLPDWTAMKQWAANNTLDFARMEALHAEPVRRVRSAFRRAQDRAKTAQPAS